jgi:hypothetical protein
VRAGLGGENHGVLQHLSFARLEEISTPLLYWCSSHERSSINEFPLGSVGVSLTWDKPSTPPDRDSWRDSLMVMMLSSTTALTDPAACRIWGS